MGFISVLLTIIFVIWALGLIGRIFLRAWVIRLQRKFNQGQTHTGYGRSSGQSSSSRAQGDINIQKTKEQQKTVPKNVGDYVEFEELD
ncbi:MAG: DUF4834 family protein [Rikenellaceae bacterium]